MTNFGRDIKEMKQAFRSLASRVGALEGKKPKEEPKSESEEEPETKTKKSKKSKRE